MKKYLPVILLLFTGISCAQTAHFSPGNYHGLPYQILVPDNAGQQKLPLVIFLHGAGERGNDNHKQLTYIDTIFQSRWFQEKYPSIILVPQCPEDKRWVEVDWSLPSFKQPEKISVPLGLTLELTDSLIKALPIDTNRIYIMGLSMGGFGTWDALARRPDFFAAAVPICGGADTNTACKISHIPVWAFHGAKDNVVPVVLDRNMYKALKHCGGNPRYTEYPNVKHGAWFKALANRHVYKWLFEQSK